tara:strand:+ start:22453 stop:23196 length:744 start_codon:yes stop_codon:yes gene_type:complete
MNELPAKIKRRMAALQAMAADTSSEQEAMAAARRLHALLAEYNMSEFKLDDEPEIEKESFEVGHDRLGIWAGRIAMGIAELYFCKVYQMPTVGKGKNRTRRFFVTGNSNYRTSAMIMINSVIDAVYHESKHSSMTERPKGVDGWSYICSFRNAAGLRIQLRCEELVAQARKGELLNEETGTNLPVLASAYDKAFTDIDAFNAHLKLRSGGQKSAAADPFGAVNGRAFGDKVGLRSGIGKTTSARLLA